MVVILSPVKSEEFAWSEKQIIFRHITGPSPAVTISNFQKAVNTAREEITDTTKADLAKSPIFWSKDARRKINFEKRAILNASNALDLSEVPDRLRLKQERIVDVLLLNSVLGFDLDHNRDSKIPNNEDVKRTGLKSWTIPSTPITLTRLSHDYNEERPRTSTGINISTLPCRICSPGDFLFSSKTVKILAADYDLTFPDLRNDSRFLNKYIGEYYEYWFYAPGGFLPPKILFYLPNNIRRLLFTVIYHHSVLQLSIAILVTSVLGFGYIKLFSNFNKRLLLSRSAGGNYKYWIKTFLSTIPLPIITNLWEYILLYWVDIHLGLGFIFVVTETVLNAFSVCLVIFSGSEALGSFLDRHNYTSEETGNKLERLSYFHSVPVTTVLRIVYILAMFLYLFNTAYSLGVNTWALLTISAVPTLILSLSMQSLIKDIVAGFTLIMENRYSVGDFISLKDEKGQIFTEGFIRSSGMRCITLKEVNGSVITIPNSIASNGMFINHRLTSEYNLELSLPLNEMSSHSSIQIKENVAKLLEPFSPIANISSRINYSNNSWKLIVNSKWSQNLSKDERDDQSELIFIKLQDYLSDLDASQF